MNKKNSKAILSVFVVTTLFSGCGQKESAKAAGTLAPVPTSALAKPEAPKNTEVILSTTTSTQDIY